MKRPRPFWKALHKDPFDRTLVAQAVADDLTLVTSDEAIHRYEVKWVW